MQNEQNDGKKKVNMKEQDAQPKVTWGGYVAFIFAIIFFSGIFAHNAGWLKVFDFSVLNGSFGQIASTAKTAINFRGTGGAGACDGFLYSLTLMPGVIFALGVISIIDGLGGLRAAQKLMTPILKPLLGIPGIAALSIVANLQSTDAAAGMVKELKQNGKITDDERTLVITYQTSASAMITNYFSSGVAVFSIMLVPIIVPVVVMLIFKVVGTNLMRLYIKMIQKKTSFKIENGGSDYAGK